MSGVSVATLTVDLIGNSAKLTAELRKATKNTKSWAESTRSVVDSAMKGIAGTAVAGAAGLGAISVASVNAGAEVSRLSAALNVATEDLTAWQYAAQSANVPADKMADIFKDINDKIGDFATTGGGGAADMFEKLNLNIEDFVGLSPDKQLLKIGQALEGVATQAEKTFFLEALAGDAALLLPLLENNAAQFHALKREAEDVGYVINSLDGKKMEAAALALSQAKATTAAFGRQLAVEVAPVMAAIAKQFSESAKEAGGFGAIATNVVAGVATGVGHAADVVNGLAVTWALLKQAALEYYHWQVKVMTAVPRLAEDALQWLGVESADMVSTYVETLGAEVEAGRKALQARALEKVPSEKIQEFVASMKADMAAAIERANQDQPIIKAPQLGETASAAKVASENEKIISLQQEKFRRIHDEALAAEGRTIELENLRYQRQMAEMEADLQRLRERKLLTTEIEEQFRRAEFDAEAIHQAKMLDLKQQAFEKEQAISQAKWQIVHDAAAMGASLFKQDSKAHRVLLAASKFAALQQSKIALQQAIAKANSLGFPANLPAIAEATTIGVGAINNLKGINIAGIAHGGLGYVPKESTYLLDKGERVLSPGQNKDLTNFMAGGGNGTVVNIHNYSGQQVEQRQNGREIDIIIGRAKDAIRDDVTRGVGLAKTFESTYSLNRRGVA